MNKMFFFMTLIMIGISMAYSIKTWSQDTLKDTIQGQINIPNKIDVEISNPPPPDQSNSATYRSVLPMSRFEFKLAIIVLIFGCLTLLVEFFLIKSLRINSEDTIKFIIITLIIIGVLFFVSAGYSNDQIAPAVGLLGTIAGYLLGKMQSSNKPEDNLKKT